MISNDGLVRCNNADNFEFINLYNKICEDYEKEKENWIKELKEQGYKAAHPNDGWVNREDNVFQLCYPYFEEQIKIGDKVMLGWHNEHKTNKSVIVVDIIKNSFGTTKYKFKEELK